MTVHMPVSGRNGQGEDSGHLERGAGMKEQKQTRPSPMSEGDAFDDGIKQDEGEQNVKQRG